MTEHPLPGDPGAGERPYDPQYSYPRYPQFADDTPPSTPPRVTTSGGTPPPGNRTGKVIAATVAAVAVIGIVLAVVVLTGTSTQKNNLSLPIPTDTSGSARASVEPPSSVAPDPGSSVPGGLPSDRAGLQRTTAATVVGIQYFSALESQDADELVPFVCAGATAAGADDVAEIDFAEPSGPAYVTGSQATMTGDVELGDGTDYELELTLAAQQTGTGWCVQSGTKR